MKIVLTIEDPSAEVLAAIAASHPQIAASHPQIAVPKIEENPYEDVDEVEDTPAAIEDKPRRRRGRPPAAEKTEVREEVAPELKTPVVTATEPVAAVEDELPFGGDVGKATEAYHGKFGIVPLKTLLKYRHHVQRGSEIKPDKVKAYLLDVQTAMTGGVPWSVEDALDA